MRTPQARYGYGTGQGSRGGFTLVEALAGSLLLALGAVLIGGLNHRCLYHNMRGMEYEQAYRLLDECLDRVVATGVGSITGKEIFSGDFAERFPNYEYVIEVAPAPTPDVYRVTATVRWKVSGDNYQVQASTLIYQQANATTP